MASPSETPSSPKETPAATTPQADAGGQPNTCEQRDPPEQPTTPPASDDALLPQLSGNAHLAQGLNDKDWAGIDIGNTPTGQTDGVPATDWVSFPTSPHRPDARLTPSPTPSEMELARNRIAEWARTNTRGGLPLVLKIERPSKE